MPINILSFKHKIGIKSNKFQYKKIYSSLYIGKYSNKKYSKEAFHIFFRQKTKNIIFGVKGINF